MNHHPLLLLALLWPLAACGAVSPTGDDVSTSLTDVASPDVTEDGTGPVDTTPPECTEDLDCDDGVDCTIDFCEADGRCSQTPNDSLCADGDMCTGVETCHATDGCRSGDPLGCGDGVDCTTDACDPIDGCASTPDDSACDDQDTCTGTETCDPTEGCRAGQALSCDDGVDCTADSCEAAIGCVNTPDDAACTDEDVCTGTEACDATQGCQPGAPLDCDDAVGCTVDTCDATDGCAHTPDDAACSDADVCTGAEICDVTQDCQPGVALDCDDGVGCTVDACDATVGCMNTPDDAVCDDALVCTGTESCDVTADCQPGVPPEGCCTSDASCDDQDVCNGVETCDMETRTCVFGQALACDDAIGCTLDSCDPIDGCVNAPDDTACDDADVCTGTETCDAALDCQPGDDLGCDDGVGCTTDSCDTTAGCLHAPDDTACDDDDVCTGTETCDATEDCQPGESLECGDGVSCTADSCDAEAGCQNTPDDTACDDADVCTGTETCDATLDCQPGEPLGCDDSVGCTADGCDAEAGCLNAPDDTACDDADVCTGTETCDATLDCQPGDALECDDGVGCTTDSCDAALGCVHTPDDAACDDADLCTGSETCDAQSDCQAGDALDCDDGVGCTVDTCDATQGCANAPDDAACDDSDVCTGTESCDATHDCQPGQAMGCDDGVACTVDLCDASEGCLYTPDDGACDDDQLCTGVETCDLTEDCQPGEALPNCCVLDGDCDDGLICTGVELCDIDTHTCLPAFAPDCDDGEYCTLDSCSEDAGPVGCVNAPALAEDIVVSLVGADDGGAYTDPVTVEVSVEGTYLLGWSATLDEVPLAGPVEVTADGLHTLVVTVEGCGIEPVIETLTFTLDNEPPTVNAVLVPSPNAAGWNNAPVTVTFVGQDALTAVTVSEPVVVATPGADQVVTGTATDAAGNTAQTEVTLHLDFKAPSVTIDQPQPNQASTDQLVTSADQVTFEGLLGDDTLSGFAYGRISSSKHASAQQFNAPGPYSADVVLEEGVNTVIVSAHDVAGNAATASLCVIRDSQPPHVFIQSPSDGYTVAEETVNVSGLAHDLVVGEVTPDEVSVTLVTAPGGIEITAVVEAGHFVVEGIPLQVGLNTLTATATDSVGLTSVHSVTVERVTGDVARLSLVSGNFQTCTVAGPVAEPLVVRLLDADDNPVADTYVAFAITSSDGTLAAEDAPMVSPDDRRVVVSTDAEGLGEVLLTCGRRSGAGVDRVTASAAEVLGSVSWFASASAASAANIYLHGGDNQRGATSEPLPIPLAVLVTDLSSNPVDGMAVTFSVVAGDGKLGGQSSVVVTTNAKGVADVAFVPGQVEGLSAHEVLAQIPPVEGSGTADGVTFTASALQARDPDQTQVSGLVVDQDEVPLAGVSIHFPGQATVFPVVTGEDGTFLYPGAPTGFAQMILDGSTVPHEGETPLYPTMTMELHNVAGRNNRLDRPVYMLKLDDPVWVDGLSDTVLTLDEAPGFAFTIPAGTQLTFPDGSHEGWLSVTQVHFDQAPMAPSDGLASRMLVTIQPPGVHFDPPAPLQIPNVDSYAPGRKVEMYSYDHDLEAFVTIGPGSVSEDGTVVRSDPGVGVVKGGWHCGGLPDLSSDSEIITASLNVPRHATGPGEVVISGSGSPGPDTGWSTAICDDHGELICEGEACEGVLNGTPSRKVKVKVIHYLLDDPTQFAQDAKEVTICDTPPTTYTINIPGQGVPLGADFALLKKTYEDFQENVETLTEQFAWMGKGGACGSSTLADKPVKVAGQVIFSEGCCGECPSEVGATKAANVTITLPPLTFSCLFTHPVLLALTKIVDVANNFVDDSDDHDTALEFKVGVEAAVSMSAQGSVSLLIDECNGSAQYSGGAKLAANAHIAGVIDVQLVGLGLHAFVGGRVGISGRVKLASSPMLNVCASACWTGVVLEASYSFDLGPFTLAKGIKTLPIACPGELYNKCTTIGTPTEPVTAVCGDSCEFAPDPDYPTPPVDFAALSACPAGPAASVFGDCATETDDCQFDSHCEDNRDCTHDTCADGVCLNIPQAGCLINGSCVGDGITIDSDCKVCDPDVDPSKWTVLEGLPCDAGDAFAVLDCGVCDSQGAACHAPSDPISAAPGALPRALARGGPERPGSGGGVHGADPEPHRARRPDRPLAPGQHPRDGQPPPRTPHL